MLFQPGHQGQVIGQAAEQGHCSVPVSVDQSGAKQHVWQFAGFVGRVLQRGVTRADEHDAAIANADGMVLEYDAGRFDRHQPGWQQE